jgi:hypothetical protein
LNQSSFFSTENKIKFTNIYRNFHLSISIPKRRQGDLSLDSHDLPRELRKKFSERDGAIATQAKEQVVKQWLAPLLLVLQGSAGCIQVTRRGLTLSVQAVRHRGMARAARGNVFLDGTLSREDLALKLGCSPDEIMVVRQKTPVAKNLEVIQVSDVGRLGMQRGSDQLKRTGALSRFFYEDDISTRIIDFKGQGADGAWWRDSRGVNDFIDVKTLVLIGTPCRNLCDLGRNLRSYRVALPPMMTLNSRRSSIGLC